MDISYFMTWFVSQVITWFVFIYETMDDITFGGTSLLRVIIFINIIIPLLYLVLTIPHNPNEIYRAEYYKQKSKKNKETGTKK